MKKILFKNCIDLTLALEQECTIFTVIACKAGGKNKDIAQKKN